MKTDTEDWLTELPPLDGGEDEEPQEGVDHEDLPSHKDDGDPRDDAASDGLVVDDGIAFEDEPQERDAEGEEPWEADVGEPELDIDERAGEGASDGDMPGLSDGDLHIEDEPAVSLDDGGEEGTSDPIDQELEGDLPELDADDHGDFEDTLLRETGLVETDLEDAELPRWADAAWQERAGSSRAIPMGERVGIAARALHFDPGGAVIMLCDDQGLLVSTDGGETAHAANGWRDALESYGRAREGLATVALAPTGPRAQAPTLWAATPSGLLLKGKNLGSRWDVAGALLRSPVGVAVSADGSLTALCADASGLELLTSADGARWLTETLSLPAGRYDDGSPPWLVRAGAALAIGHGSGVMLSRDGGRTFTALAGTWGAVSAAFAGEGPNAPLLVLVRRDAENKTYLVRSPLEGPSEVIGELGDAAHGSPETSGDGDAAGPAALLWDAAAQVVWVAFVDRVSAWG
jgi:hypothetical protein